MTTYQCPYTCHEREDTWIFSVLGVLEGKEEDIFLKISLGNEIGENSFYLLRIWYLWNDIQ
jgi:hypothetical protein